MLFSLVDFEFQPKYNESTQRLTKRNQTAMSRREEEYSNNKGREKQKKIIERGVKHAEQNPYRK